MAVNGLMTTQGLNAIKGWPDPNVVDFSTKVSPTVTTVVKSGSVVSLDAAGNYVPGVGKKRVMPMFLFPNSDDFDVRNDGGDPSVDAGVYVAFSPEGAAMALPSVAAVELASPMFVPGSYPPNTHLTSPMTGANAGKLVAGTVGTDTIVGIVSRGLVANGYGSSQVLAFWPIYIPGDNT